MKMLLKQDHGLVRSDLHLLVQPDQVTISLRFSIYLKACSIKFRNKSLDQFFHCKRRTLDISQSLNINYKNSAAE